MTLVPVDTSNGLAVSDYLDKARQWLHTAVEMTGPAEIAMAKAEIATAAEATKQLGLSKDIQLDAKEMVRRAEYALGKAIRKGQSEGTIATHGGGRSTTGTPTLTSPSEFATKQELSGAGHQQPGVYALAEAEPADFEAAIGEAKAEGDLSRANVARKAREKSGVDASPWTWLDRLAEHGSGIGLVFARTETAGFVEQVWGKADAVLFLHGRLYFHHADGTRAAANSGAPSCLVAYGFKAARRLADSGLPGSLVSAWRPSAPLVPGSGINQGQPEDVDLPGPPS